MQARFEHAAEDVLERYVLGTLPAGEGEALEEHLLVCPDCQDQLAETDVYVHIVRIAAANVAREAITDRRPWFGWFSDLATVAKLSWTAAAAVCVILLCWVGGAWRSSHVTPVPPVSVILQAARGEGGVNGARAPRGRPLLFQADAAGLASQTRCELEVVDLRGRALHRLPTTDRTEWMEGRLPGGLATGRYWVRLYTAGPRRELLREYALTIE